jgi:DNA primase
MTTLRNGSHEELHNLIARVDLPALVERYTPLVRRTGSTWHYRCPHLAHEDRNPSFTVQVRNSREFARCWSRCSWSGDALDLVEWLEQLDRGFAIRWLCDHVGDAPRVSSRYSTSLGTVDLASIETRVPPERVARASLDRYLDRRGVPGDERPVIVEEFALSTVLDDRGLVRIRHPYLVPDGLGSSRVAWWQDRALGPSPIRWLSPRGARSVLYNLPALEDRTIRAVVVCEGPGDTITATRALRGDEGIVAIGIPGASSWRDSYSALLTDLAVVIATDNDDAGEQLAHVITRSAPSARRAEFTAPDLTELALEEGLGAVRDSVLREVTR